MPRRPGPRVVAPGLAGLRRPGAISELGFLHELATAEVYRLRDVADRLGLTVQAASHLYRQLRSAGLVTIRQGRYRPTVAGIDWLHSTLNAIGDDIQRWRDRLPIVRTTRAIAGADLRPGTAVRLELSEGVLTARPGAGAGSRGRAVGPAGAGEFVEVGELSGIVPIAPATIRVRTISERDLPDPAMRAAIAREALREPGLVAADGLEAAHLVRRAGVRRFLRFGVGAATREAAQLGVPSTVFVHQGDLARLLATYGGSDPPEVTVEPLRSARGRVRRAGTKRSRLTPRR